MIHYMTGNGIGNAWVANELRIIAERGIPFVLHSMRRPDSTHHESEWARRIDARTRVLYPMPPLGLAFSVLASPFLFGGRAFGALMNALFGERETLRGRVACLFHFFAACHWARQLRTEEVSLIHSQWVHSTGSIAMYGAWLLGVPFSFTGHAADLFRDRVALRDKIRRADFIVCISLFHLEFFSSEGARPEQLELAYCGIDTRHFSPPGPYSRRDGAPVRIRSSGRLVEKKGFPILIEACGLLRDRGVPFECTIGGSGPMEAELKEQVERLRLRDSVTVTGRAIKQEEIPEFMGAGDVYALPCVWASDNDVDGLPQMLMEAMACGLPVVSTRLVGIPDLVHHEKTGLLVEPNDAHQLADALQRLAEEPGLGEQLAAAGRQQVLESFDIATSLEPLVRRYRAHLDRHGDDFGAAR